MKISSKKRRLKLILVHVLILSVIFPQTTLGITPIKFPDISKAENKKAVETTKEKPGKFLDKIKGPRVYPDFLDSATKGIGYKFNSGSDYLDIRLSGYPAADGLTLGNKRIYSVTDNINVVYTESYRKVKEDIVLFKKPQDSKFSFSLSKSNLSVKKESDGYHFYDLLNEEVFFIPNPTVIDKNGKSGKAAMEITDNSIDINVDPEFLSGAAYPVTIDPTVIATSTSVYATGLNNQRKTFFDGTRYWAFYSDGTNIVYRFSLDGDSWSSPTTLAAGSQGYNFSLWYKNQEVYVALTNGWSVNAVRGDVSGASITWGSQTTVFQGSSGSSFYFLPAITSDSNGKLFISSTYILNGNRSAVSKKSLLVDNVSQWDETFDLDPDVTASNIFTNLIPLPNGQLYAIWMKGNVVQGRLYDGANWGSIVSLGNSFLAENIGSIPSAVAKEDGTIYLAYTKSVSPYNLVYKTGVSPFGATDWSAESDLAIDGSFFPSLSLDSSTSQVYAFYEQWLGDGQYRLKSKRVGSSHSYDLSDSSERALDSVVAYSDNYKSYTDVGLAAADTNVGDVKNADTGKLLSAIGDYFYVGMNEKFDSVFFDLGTVAQGLLLKAYYWDGSTWSPLTFTDNTINLSITEKDVTFSPPSNWSKNSGYYYVVFTSDTNPSAAPIGDQVTAFKTNLFTSANYSGASNQFMLNTEGSNSAYRVKFSSTRNISQLGTESHYPTFSKDLKAANINVNLSSGNFILQKQDLTVPARGFPTEISHTYNSRSDYDGDFGYGWTISANQFVKPEAPEWNIYYQDGDGTKHMFKRNPDGTYRHPPGVYLDLMINIDGTYVLTSKDKTVYTFGVDGKLVSVKDKNNNTATYTYTGGKLTGINDASNRNTTLSYNAGGKLEKIKDMLTNREITYTYDAQSGDLIRIADPAGNQTNFSYSNHNIVSVTDPGNNSTDFAFNGLDKLTTITDALNFSTTFLYKASQTTVTDPRQNTTAYNISPDNLLSSQVDALGGRSSYQYDDDYNRIAAVDANGGEYNRAYDGSGNLLSETDPLSTTTVNAYENNNLTSKVDALGRATSYAYDAKSNLINETDALNNTTTYTIDNYGQRTAVVAQGNTTTYDYDDYGQVVSQSDPLNNVTNYKYDGSGNKISESQPTFYIISDFEEEDVWQPEDGFTELSADSTNTKHGSQGLKAEVILGGGGPPDPNLQYPNNIFKSVKLDLGSGYNDTDTISYWRYHNGAWSQSGSQLYFFTDDDNYFYGGTGRKNQFSKVGNPSWQNINKVGLDTTITPVNPAVTYDDLRISTNKKTTFSYNSQNLVTKITDSLDSSTVIEYDGLGNKLSETNAQNKTKRFFYDALNRLTTETDPLGNDTIYEYDGAGNKIKETNARGHSTVYTYDQLNRLETVTDSLGNKTVYAYDALGNKISEASAPTLRWNYYDGDLLPQYSDPVWQKQLNGAPLEEINPVGTLHLKANTNSEYIKYTYTDADLDNARGSSVKAKLKVGTNNLNQFGIYFLIEDGTHMARVAVMQDSNANGRRVYFEDGAQIQSYFIDTSVYHEYEASLVGNTAKLKIDGIERLTLNNITYPVTEKRFSFGHYGYYQPTESWWDYVQIGNRESSVKRFSYDPLNRVSTETDPLGFTTVSVYDAVGNKTRTIDAGGNQTSFKYDELNRLTQTTDTLGNISYKKYDTFGNLTEDRDARSSGPNDNTYKTAYQYDGNNRMIRKIDALGNTTEIEYDPLGNKTVETDPRGFQQRSYPDPFGRFQVTAKPHRDVAYTEFDNLGQKVKESAVIDKVLTDMELDETWSGGEKDFYKYEQGFQGRKVTSLSSTVFTTRTVDLDLQTGYQEPYGEIRFWVMIDDGLTLSDSTTTLDNAIIFETSPGNYFWKSWFDDSFYSDMYLAKREIVLRKGDFHTVGTPSWGDINKVSFTGTSNGLLGPAEVTFDYLRFQSAQKIIKMYEYDALGRNVKTTDAKNQSSVYTYDPVGNIIKEIDAMGNESTATFDADNRKIAQKDQLGNVTRFAFDESDNKISETNPLGDVTTFGYDSNNRQERVTDSLGNATRFEYDALGNKIDETNPNNEKTSYDYDTMNRQVKVTEPELKITSYAYDEVSNQLGITPPAQTTTTLEYDPVNRLKKKTEPNGRVTQTDYDSSGNKLNETVIGSGAKTAIFTYDGLSRLTSVTDTDSTSNYFYDARGNKIKEVKNGEPVYYSYDELDRLEKIIERGRVRKPNGFDANGNVTSYIELYNNFTQDVALSYDDKNRLVGLSDTFSATNTIGYDSNSNRASLINGNGIKTVYSYDDANRLKSLETSASSGLLLDYDYSYDSKGNIIAETLSGFGTTNYTYDSNNQLLSFTSPNAQESYTYSDSGNLLTKTVAGVGTSTYTYNQWNELETIIGPGGNNSFTYDEWGNLKTKATPNGNYTFTWNADDQMVGASGPGLNASYTYDVSGRRMSKTVNGIVTNFVYFENQLVAEKDITGNVTASYLYDDRGALVSMRKNNQSYYFHLNARGDVVKISDENQVVVAEYSYDPWGNILSATGSFANSQPFRYAGYYWDSELSIYYLINRYYDPSINRFTSIDSEWDMEDQGIALNAYAYVKNNPVMGVDPDGLHWDGNPNYHRWLRLTSPYTAGEDVRWVQRALITIGYYLGPWGPSGRGDDGYFGPVTNRNVRSYQGSHRDTSNRWLAVDGIVGSLTWGALARDSGGGAASPSPAPSGPANQPAISEGPVPIQFPHSGSATAYLRTVLKVNGRYALFHYQDIDWFYYMVKGGGQWDLKLAAPSSGSYNRDEKFLRFRGTMISPDDFGNIHFGFVGRKLGLSLGELKTGSFVTHFGDNGPRMIMKEFADHAKITYGYNLPYGVQWVVGITHYTR